MEKEKTFIVKGTYRQGKETKKFTKEITSGNKNFAKEKTLAGLGSKHKVIRNAITITSIDEKEATQ